MNKLYLFVFAIIMIMVNTQCSETKIDAKKYTQVSAQNQMLYVWSLNGILNYENNSNDFIFGGEENKNQACVDCYQENLKDWWDITDEKSLLSTINQLKKGNMHNVDFKEEYQGFYDLNEDEFNNISAQTPEYYDLDTLVFNNKDIYKEKGIVAWDMVRASSLVAWGYLAGYIDINTAYNQCLDIGKRVQKNFSSYAQMVENYLAGYLYWSEDVDAYNKRKEIAAELFENENSAWNVFPFDFDLTEKELETEITNQP